MRLLKMAIVLAFTLSAGLAFASQPPKQQASSSKKAAAESIRKSSSSKRTIVLSKDNVLSLNSAVDSESVAKLIKRAQELDANLDSGYPIILFLYTPGGSIQDGLELIEALKSLNRPVQTVSMFAASMGWQILQSLDKRMVLETGVLMSHKARGGFYGEFGDGVSQLDARYALWLQRILDMDMITVQRSNGKQTLDSYRKAYENELWITGRDAVAKGYADEVVSVKCDKSLSGTTKESFFFMGIEIIVVFSECPMNTSPLAVTFNMQTNKGFMTYEEFVSKGGNMGSSSSYYYSSTEKNQDNLIYTGDQEYLDKARKAVVEFKKDFKKKQTEVIRSY